MHSYIWRFLRCKKYLHSRKKGGMFVSMPSFKTKTGDEKGNPVFKDIAFPITKEFREELYANIMESYESGENVVFDWG